jgi:hypothetical protein
MELLKLDPSKRSECATHLVGECGICSDDPLIEYYSKIIQVSPGESHESIVDRVKQHLGVEKESDIFLHQSVVDNLGRGVCKKILKKYFKTSGPRHTTELLNNFNIDDTLAQWAENSQTMFGRKFKHIGFQMIDFYETYGELNNINLDELVREGCDSLACVLNTDVSTGGGKHWFCVFSDLHKKDGNKYVIELFNSSGNPPTKEMTDWISRLNNKHPCIIRKAIRKRLQDSRTECGVWCLAYIYWKLRGCDNETFEEYMTDDKMIEFRNFLFR